MSGSEFDKMATDQDALFSKMFEGIAQMGNVQKVVARSMIDVHMEQKQKMLVSGNLAAAINALNRASHLLMRTSTRETGDSGNDEDDGFDPQRH